MIRLRREHRPDRTRRPRRVHAGWPTIVGLTLLWWVLWGTWSPISLLGGLVVAVLVVQLFPLPVLRIRGRLRPFAAVVLVARLLADIVVATAQVSWVTLFPPKPLRNAVVAVHLRTDSDLVLSTVVTLVSLVPGSVVVEVDRVEHVLYLHVLDVRRDDDVERARAAVLAQEDRVLRAITVGAGPGDRSEQEGAAS